MGQDFILMFDSNSELPLEIQEKYKAPFVRMPYVLGDQEYAYDLGKNTDFKAFYAAERSGAMPKTMMLPPQHYEDFWRPYLEAGQDILFVMFSSGLSGAYDCATMARESILKEFPQRTIKLVDTLSISVGCGLLVYGALQKKEAGASMEEIEKWVLENRMRVNHIFSVDDLNFLRRGGRVSSATAVVGTLLDVKPVLMVDRQGKLVNTGKIKGRKKVIRYLADQVVERMTEPEKNILVILHADQEEAAKQLEQLVLERCQPKEVWLRYVGPVIGTHAGPGTLAVVFMGKERV